MSTETTLKTFTDVKFIQGVTPMNQANWQKYFGAALKNGVYKGLHVSGFSNQNNIQLEDGILFVNGIFAFVETAGGSTLIAKSPTTDRFIFARLHLDSETVEIVEKTGLTANGYEWQVVEEMQKFIDDESYSCTRTSTIYDVPLFYQGPDGSGNNYGYGIDLRRTVEIGGNLTTNPDVKRYVYGTELLMKVSSDHHYSATELSYNGTLDVYLDPVDLPNGATIYNADQVKIHLAPWINNILGSNLPSSSNWPQDIGLIYSSRWTLNSGYISRSGPVSVRIDYLYTDTSGLHPKPYFAVVDLN